MHRLRFSLSFPPDCPYEEATIHGIIATAGGMLHDQAKARSFSTSRAEGWVTTDWSKGRDNGISGTVFLAHVEVEGREFDIRFILADVTADEPVPPSSPERFNVRHVPSGLLN